MDSLNPVSRGPTLSERVATQLLEIIASGQIKPGEKLPSEGQLCKAVHVGRSTLRKALKSLAYIGQVRMWAGEGCFVAKEPSKLLERVFHHGLLNTQRDVKELAETRVLIETELAALCAQRRTEEDLRQLEFLISEMQRSVQKGGNGFLQLDVNFHFAIAKGAQHRVLCQLLKSIGGLLKDRISKGLEAPRSAADGLKGHQQVFHAIK